MSLVHPQQFARIARRFSPIRATRTLSLWEHFLAMTFAHLTFRESLRDLVACLDARPSLRYHLGFKHRVALGILAEANEQRDWWVFAAVAEHLMGKARNLYSAESRGYEGLDSIYALDASIIDLSLALCPWANWTGHDAAVTLHILLDLRGSIPDFVRVTAGECYETAIFPLLPIEPGSYYLMDRGDHDFATFYRMHLGGVFLVTRAKCNVRFVVRESRPVDHRITLRPIGPSCQQSARQLYPKGSGASASTTPSIS